MASELEIDDSMALNPPQGSCRATGRLTTMEEQGFLVIPELLSRSEIDGVLEEMERFRRDVLPGMPRKAYLLEAENAVVRSIYWMNLYDPFFRELPSHPKIVCTAAEVASWEPRPFFVESYWKSARIGSAIPLHQDNIYSSLQPPHELTIWIALDPASEANGGVTYLPGSQQEGLLPHQQSQAHRGNMSISPSVNLSRFERATPSLLPGDAIAHTCLTIHGSGPNLSAHPRRGIAIGFRGVEAQVDPCVIEGKIHGG